MATIPDPGWMQTTPAQDPNRIPVTAKKAHAQQMQQINPAWVYPHQCDNLGYCVYCGEIAGQMHKGNCLSLAPYMPAPPPVPTPPQLATGATIPVAVPGPPSPAQQAMSAPMPMDDLGTLACHRDAFTDCLKNAQMIARGHPSIRGELACGLQSLFDEIQLLELGQ